MSEMVLRMPSSFVDVERDEMEYVDGGGNAIQEGKIKVLVFTTYLVHVLIDGMVYEVLTHAFKSWLNSGASYEIFPWEYASPHRCGAGGNCAVPN